MLVVGTTLETQLPRLMVVEALKNDVLTVDVNPKSAITKGKALVVEEACETSLPKLVSAFQKN